MFERTEQSELACLIEGNESDAYRSFFRVAARLHGDSAFRCRQAHGATLFTSPLIAKAGVFNRVLGLGLTHAVSAEALEAVVVEFRGQDCGLALDLAPPALSPLFREALRRQRIRRGATAAVVRCAPRLALPKPVSELRVDRAVDEDARTVAAICASVFAMSPEVEAVLAALANEREWRLWLCRVSGQPAGAALSFVQGDKCWFGWAATQPAFRGVGVKGAVDDERMADAARSGCQLITSETAAGTAEKPDHSLKSFQRRGFDIAYLRETYFLVPARSRAD
jgi:Acetyltransferase (GNAT) domain